MSVNLRYVTCIFGPGQSKVFASKPGHLLHIPSAHSFSRMDRLSLSDFSRNPVNTAVPKLDCMLGNRSISTSTFL